jgi:hypothetical protein
MITDKAFIIGFIAGIVDRDCMIYEGEGDGINTPALKFKKRIRNCYCTVCCDLLA